MTKISKILLPISGATIAACSITPLVGCNKDGKWANAVDLMTFHPDPNTVYDGEQKTMTPEQAAETLFGDKNAVELVRQDILNYLSWELRYEMDWAKTLFGLDWVGPAKAAKCAIHDLKVSYDSTKKQGRLSGTIRLKAECDMVNPDMRTELIGSYTLETEHVIKNMPYTMSWTTVTFMEQIVYEYWTSYFDLTTLKNDNEWSVDLSYYGKATYNNGHEPEEASGDGKFTKDNVEEEHMTFLSLIRWWSYYLYKVKQTTL